MSYYQDLLLQKDAAFHPPHHIHPYLHRQKRNQDEGHLDVPNLVLLVLQYYYFDDD
jgi:hypothetical protein